MDRTLKIAIIISLAVHAGLIGSMFVSPLFLSKDIPGPGSDVQVWLAVPGASYGGATGSGDAVVTKRRKKGTAKKRAVPKPSPDAMKTPSKLAMVPLKKGEASKGLDADEEGAASKDAEAGGGGEDSGAGGLSVGRGGDQLLAKIWKRINSSKYYPSSARRRGLTGAPKVSFAINKNGKIKWVKLASTCGKKLLDDAALETVRRAAPLPYYPKPITVVVKYSLTQ